MIRWTRARVATLCGRCHQQIAVGDPLQLLGVGVGNKIQKYRCTDCAGPAPPDLPTTLMTAPPVSLDLTRIGLLSLDATTKADDDDLH